MLELLAIDLQSRDEQSHQDRTEKESDQPVGRQPAKDTEKQKHKRDLSSLANEDRPEDMIHRRDDARTPRPR